MGDIDILIPANQLDAWSSHLKDKGLSLQDEDTWEANDFKRIFIAKKDNAIDLISVELHTRLFYNEPISVNWAYKSSPFPKLSFLKEEELFVHLCGHLAYQHSFINLQWLYDIALVSSRESLDWGKVQYLATNSRVYRSCELICIILDKYFGIKNKLNIGLHAKLASTILSKEFLCYPTNSKFRYFLVKIICKDSLWHSIKYHALWANNYFLKR